GYMRANWLCGRFCVQASSFENYIAEKAFTDRFVQQSLLVVKVEALSQCSVAQMVGHQVVKTLLHLLFII
ncbi:hypothetical protein QR665_12735, partial [Acinetobacter gerneri]|uniref:hypothetical protein n=1 Tax=Acinetobacter gerneri TaxID=202952 RepID=UPI002935E624